MLDEPTQGMSLQETHRTVDTLKAMLQEESLTVVLVEHDMDVVFSLADRIAVLHRGRLIADGTVEEVKADAGVQDAYLGGLD
jgi:branched-chain amino acid transport system ATP-binding protein